MRKPLSGFVPKVSTSAIERSLGAPVGGLNSCDPLAGMGKTDALVLDNFICRPTSVDKRKGQVNFVTGFAAAEKVWSLFPFRSPPVDQMFAATDSGIYNATVAGAVGAKVANCTSGRWETINGSNAGIRYLLAVNGQDPMKFYNGAAWADAVITGVDSSTFTNINQFKFRVFLTKKDSLSFWYLDVNAVQGVAHEFPLAPLFTKGGSLLSIGTWTVDGGNGPDDYAVFVTTEGEVAVYKGTDPSNADAWALVGVYQVARPIGRKCLTKYGGDVLILTEEGVVMLSKAMSAVETDRRTSITDKIVGQLQALASAYKANFGWSITLYPAESILIINVPVVEGGTSYQMVMNNLTGAWSMFRGMNAQCFLELGSRLFYGMATKVVQALSSDSDFGNNILLTAKLAFTGFGYNLKNKQIELIRQNFKASKALTINMAVGVNYEDSPYIATASVSPNNQAQFDVSTWDGANWAGSEFIISQWRSVAHKPGYALSYMFQVNDKEFTMSWNSTDFLINVGSAL